MELNINGETKLQTTKSDIIMETKQFYHVQT